MMGNTKDNMTKHNSVKDKLIDFVKAFLLVLSMGMGFFYVYLLIWASCGLPETLWAMGLLLALAGLTEFGYFRWVR